MRLEKHKQQGEEGKKERKKEKKVVIEIQGQSESVTVEGNNQNPPQEVGLHCDEQANGGINLYLSPLTFLSREDKRGKKLIR